MPRHISSSELNKIEEQDIHDALVVFAEGDTPHDFGESTKFDLLVAGRRFPPKAIVGLAAKRPLGRVLKHNEFSGGMNRMATRLLLDRGFEAATKIRRIGSLDAQFSVGENAETRFLIVESGGGRRNTDYLDGLELILAGLADLDAVLVDAFIDTGETRNLSLDKRRLNLKGQSYPIHLRTQADILGLRKALSTTAADTPRRSGSSTGGNSTKRLRLEIDVPGELSLLELADFLSDTAGMPADHATPFVFAPGAPGQGTDDSERKALGPATVTHDHAVMQHALYEKLASDNGVGNVRAECPMACGRPADLVVQTPVGFSIFEIKTSLKPRDCIRQALGQLLEYSCWPGSGVLDTLWVVGPRELDEVASEYLATLQENFKLPIKYLHQPDTEQP